jgi:UDP-N-acetylmuramate--alanine ligase
LPRIKKAYTTYGLTDDADIYASDVLAAGEKMQFTVHFKKNNVQPFKVTLNLPGRHNVLNALAAIGVAVDCGASVDAIQSGLANFEGVGRRFQRYGEVAIPSGSFSLVDDYGHHPAEMAATLEAVRGAFPDRRLVLVFQPHRFSRTRDLFEDFIKVLSLTDALILTDVYAAGESPIVAADSRALARAIRVLGQIEPVFVEDVQKLPESILALTQNNDVVITMGAGSIGGIPAKVVSLSKEKQG